MAFRHDLEKLVEAPKVVGQLSHHGGRRPSLPALPGLPGSPAIVVVRREHAEGVAERGGYDPIRAGGPLRQVIRLLRRQDAGRSPT